jgi:hypothetical protein
LAETAASETKAAIPKDVTNKACELKESLQKKLDFIRLAKGYLPTNALEPLETQVNSALNDLDRIIKTAS